MRRGRTWTVRLQLLGVLLLMGATLTLPTLLPSFCQETETTKPWTGKLRDGREITREAIDKILQSHALWVKSKGQKGQRATLSEADLSGADLSGVNLIEANLSGVSLIEANLSRANLGDANLSRARLDMANLSEAVLTDANLSRADLRNANLSGASLWMANLSEAKLYTANLRGAQFEPKPGSVSDVSLLLNIKGLSLLRYDVSSHGLVELREAFKKAGMREQEREVAFALNHTRREKLWKEGGLLNRVESLFQLVCFEWTCQFGMSPGRPLKILFVGFFCFALPYMLALKSRKKATGIWLMLMPERVLGRGGKDRPYKMTTQTPFRPLHHDSTRFGERILRGWRVVRLGFYFSLLSAFSLGWRELNVGNWITRIQKREYTLRATGWVRSVAGLQSLLSVYLLALWVLSYFGRPFD